MCKFLSFLLLIRLLSVVGLGTAYQSDKKYLSSGYVVKYYSSHECKNHDGLGLLAVKLLNSDVYDEPQEGCIQTTETPDGTYEGKIKPLTQSVEYRKDEGPPLQSGYLYMQYDNSTNVCEVSDATPIWQEYWFLGMCAVTKDLDNYFTLHEIDFNTTSFHAAYTNFDRENVDCNPDALTVIDGTTYDLDCGEDNGSADGQNYWVQLHNMEATQAVTVDYGGALHFYPDQESCTGNSLDIEILNTQYVEDIFGIDEITYDTCIKQSNESDFEYYEAKCLDNLGKGFMALNLDSQQSFACAGDIPVSGSYFQEDGCLLMENYDLPYNSASYTDMIFNDDNISYTLHYHSDNNCEIEVISAVIYVDLNVQCGKNTFYVAYPNGFQVDCTKAAGDEDDDYESEKHLDTFEIWFIYVVCAIVVVSALLFGTVWCWRRRRGRNTSENDLINQALLGSHQDIK